MDQAALSRLQQHLAAGGQLSEVLPELLPGQDADNPALGLLSQLLAQRQEQLAAHLQEADSPEFSQAEELERERLLEAQAQQRAEELQRAEARRERMLRLRERFEDMNAELRWSRALLDELALALGACPTCWGEESHCRLCRGRGHPGFLTPDPETFARLVAPALNRQPSPLSPLAAAGPIPPERTMP
ncbi:hypothetical protein [Deinococcus sp.]|uniref:hypothetical protein n=1 Tax=Deinococcus sp. TaxID=47478 RepID=UPI003CC6AC5D